MRGVLAFFVLIGLAGCKSEPVQDFCGASELQTLVGQDRSVLETMRFGVPIRVIEFGQVMTMDFNPNRLNILLKQSGVIERVWCG